MLGGNGINFITHFVNDCQSFEEESDKKSSVIVDDVYLCNEMIIDNSKESLLFLREVTFFIAMVLISSFHSTNDFQIRLVPLLLFPMTVLLMKQWSVPCCMLHN
jgi:hypothetical protein